MPYEATVTDPVVEIRGLTKTYRAGLGRTPVHAVKDLAMTIARGSIMAFVGPNGAGKTTTIHTLLGFLKPDAGSVRVFGVPPGPLPLRRIGYQPEVFNTYPFYKPAETLRFYGGLSGMSREAVDRMVPALLDRMGLAEAANRRVATFSKGMTQRLGLAQALLHDPEFLILDEPTSGLDPEGRRLVLDIISEEKARGRTVLLSSHILSDVERISDDVVMVAKGEVAFAEPLTAFSSADADWEIEVARWTGASRGALAGHEFVVEGEQGGSALLVCAPAAKQALLRAVACSDLQIGTVKARRHGSLEERYLQHTRSA
jgi:ABC-2 type transport system ATP-binding protein